MSVQKYKPSNTETYQNWKRLHYKKWTKPTVEQLNAVLNSIATRFGIATFDGQEVPFEIRELIRSKLGIDRDTARTYCTNVEKMKYPVWVLLNAMAKNDLSSFLKVDANHSKAVMSKLLGEDAFKSGKDFKLSDVTYEVAFQSTFVAHNTAIISEPLTNLNRADFADMFSINYTVLSRNLNDLKLRLIHAKILLLVLGFDVEEIGL
ncbi:hypothetical protein SL034_004311 [Vibrio harveyi]|uniref:hypothetical protein n=1 Tax=Vibrio harveyi group TaxID=717610 RepID=UPI0009718713|nr:MULTISPECIES: hypothetical protein [Vibrio harveyi group]APX10077.1 hypothetical protein BWP24_28215 [Vibrio campbellii]ELY1989223.1 hypothetical protein [Vibrio harveyi]WCP78844.1 hypothetical protein PPW95_25415 [Vibrio parahaemolyticus]